MVKGEIIFFFKKFSNFNFRKKEKKRVGKKKKERKKNIFFL